MVGRKLSVEVPGAGLARALPAAARSKLEGVGIAVEVRIGEAYQRREAVAWLNRRETSHGSFPKGAAWRNLISQSFVDASVMPSSCFGGRAGRIHEVLKRNRRAGNGCWRGPGR